MEDYKIDFINFLLNTGALKVGNGPIDGLFSLKSKRTSPWFVNIGDFNDGKSTLALGQFFANAITNSGETFDLLYGIPEKGNALAVATVIALALKEKNVPWFVTRKFPKDYGEASAMKGYGDARTIREFITATQHLSHEDRIKAWVVGRVPKKDQSLVQLDDVFTAGDAKYEARELLRYLGNFKLPLLTIGVDRQEVGIDATGRSAIEEYEKTTGTKVSSIVNALDVYNFLRELPAERLSKVRQEIAETSAKISDLEKEVDADQSPSFGTDIPEKIKELASVRGDLTKLNDLVITYDPRSLVRLTNYLRVYGTETARNEIVKTAGKLEQKIIAADRSIIPACDISTLEDFEDLVQQTADVNGIGGYKIGFELGLGFSLLAVVAAARKHTDKPIIYDHQKAGTDIPDTGKNFAEVCKKAGVDAVILFPQAGPETERAWIYHALDKGLKVIVGGRMTHPAYSVSEGGYITDEGALDMYRLAARAGVNNFVVPGNKPDVIKQIRAVVEAEGVSPVFYAPGFVTQGGKIEDATKVAGDNWHAIVGRGIYQARDRKAAALEHTSKLII